MQAKNRKHKTTLRRRLVGTMLAAAAAIVVASSCSFDITNPGGAQDEFLDSLNAHEALVVGTRASLADAMQVIIYLGAAMTFEINPAGSTGSFGIESFIQAGNFRNNLSGEWNGTQEARWTAEDAALRFQRSLAALDSLGFENVPDYDSYEPAATALMWAGFASRLLGENFCEVTLNGSGLLPHTAAYQRADSVFQDALAIANANGDMAAEVTAIHAGRASVLANLATYGLATWTAAAAEAALVPNDFVLTVPYSNASLTEYNYLYWAAANLPYRAHTVWGTYWASMPDPRTPFDNTTGLTGDAAVQKFGGSVPFWPEMKDSLIDSPVNVASGWEARLIEAEAALAGNDLTEAANQMNLRRADLGLALFPVPFASLADGYTALKTERAAELWLEGRRMGDVRRWMENNIPGDYIDGNYRDVNQVDNFPTKVEDLSTRDRAYFVGLSEVETNPLVTAAQLRSCSPGG